ncbi:hypothetical protein Pdw03_5261 [Penicillium digitatum]|uniref:Uncharacterized protein n=1 Tax=Penicillium digitatum TaxID=36651 RepID=A0A7T7BPS7_PENDI|nr:hypothetical protein Pdw03_5261 [Penicillium digitatum]
MIRHSLSIGLEIIQTGSCKLISLASAGFNYTNLHFVCSSEFDRQVCRRDLSQGEAVSTARFNAGRGRYTA